MAIQQKTWFRFLAVAVLSLAVWLTFTYPQFAFINLSVTRAQALKAAQNYLLQEIGVDFSSYQNATVFVTSGGADRYLQKSLGFEKEIPFLQKHRFDLFFWKIRFFRELQKEEYDLTVSAATGEVIGFSHTIEASASRPYRDMESSQQKAITFLSGKFDFDPQDYVLHSEQAKKLENRTDYYFTWQKKNVFLTWSDEPDTGGALLLTGAAVSGDEIFSFQKNGLKIPDQFYRYLSRQKVIGQNLALVFRIIFFSLLTASIFIVAVRRNNLVMHVTKRFCVGLTFFIFLLNLATYFNEFEGILFYYPTTSSMASYLWRHVIDFVMDTFIVTIGILMPCLAGESLHYEVFPKKKEGGFLHYILSTVWSRSMAQAIGLGYLVGLIMIGIQSAAFHVGQTYLGVWVEHTWMAQYSSSYLPFLSAFILGFNASTTEEISFRLFSISLGKRILKSTWLAALLASIFWGYGHSTYLVFPMWFRGLEVTCLGVFLSYVYLRYGIFPVIVGHFLFDVFWGSCAYLLGHATDELLYSSLAVLLLPLLIAAIAYIRNKPEVEHPLEWKLNRHQTYNIDVLRHYLRETKLLEGKSEQEMRQLRDEIASHGWDLCVVEMAINDVRNPSATKTS